MIEENQRHVLAEGKYVRLVKRGRWEWVERTNCASAVVIMPVTREREVVFIEQYRHPLDAKVIELPAGLVGDDPGTGDEERLAAANANCRRNRLRIGELEVSDGRPQLARLDHRKLRHVSRRGCLPLAQAAATNRKKSPSTSCRSIKQKSGWNKNAKPVCWSIPRCMRDCILRCSIRLRLRRAKECGVSSTKYGVLITEYGVLDAEYRALISRNGCFIIWVLRTWYSVLCTLHYPGQVTFRTSACEAASG